MDQNPQNSKSESPKLVIPDQPISPQETPVLQTPTQQFTQPIPAQQTQSQPLTPGQLATPQQSPNLIPQNQQPQQEGQIPPPTQPHFPKALKIILPILTLLVIAAFGSTLTLAYTNYSFFKPPKTVRDAIDTIVLIAPLPKNPRMIIQKSLMEMSDIKTAIQENSLSVKVEGESPVKSFQIVAKGPLDFKAADISKSEADISAEVETEGIKISAAGSVKQIDKTLYFKITEMPASAFLPTDTLKNQWFYLDLSKFEDQNSEQNKQQYEKIVEEIQQILKDFIGKSHEWTTLTEGSNNTYNLKISPPKKEISNLFYEIIGAVEPIAQTSTEENIEKEQLDKFLNYINDVEIKLQVSKDNFLIDEMNASFTLNIELPSSLKDSGAIMFPIADNLKVKVDLASKFTNFNKPIIIEIPEGAKDITTYYEELMNSYGSQELPQEFSPQQLEENLLPEETINPQEIAPLEENPTSIHELLQNQSPVLGEKSNWDLNLINFLKIFSN